VPIRLIYVFMVRVSGWLAFLARTEGSAQRISVSNADGSRRRYRAHMAAVPAHPLAGNRRAWGVSASDVSALRVPFTSGLH
jgi:hypothetical protein